MYLYLQINSEFFNNHPGKPAWDLLYQVRRYYYREEWCYKNDKIGCYEKFKIFFTVDTDNCCSYQYIFSVSVRVLLP